MIDPCEYMEMLEYMDNIVTDKDNLENLSDQILTSFKKNFFFCNIFSFFP